MSPAALALSLVSPNPSDRVLIVVPGRSGAAVAGELLRRVPDAILVDSSTGRLNAGSNGLRVRGQATRLPFARHTFNAILSFESLYCIRPPWTVLAEFHRVLVPDGKLVLLEPARHGIFSALRDRVAGPGKRVFDLEEVRVRLKRADYSVQRVEDPQRLDGMPFPAWCVLATKIEFAAEPAPSFTTAKELIEKQRQRQTQAAPVNQNEVKQPEA